MGFAGCGYRKSILPVSVDCIIEVSLGSFAQFEREVIAERIRDKVAASKKKGMWMGGNVPLGYEVVDLKLVVDDQEAQSVRWRFNRYLDLRSLTDVS